MERATADPLTGADAGPPSAVFWRYLTSTTAAAGAIAVIAASKLARAASDLVSAAVYRRSVAATGVT